MTDRPIADIAFDVGFENLSVFNDNFRRLKRLSPQSYRRLACADSFEIELPRRRSEGEPAERFLEGRVLADCPDPDTGLSGVLVDLFDVLVDHIVEIFEPSSYNLYHPVLLSTYFQPFT